MNNRVPVLSVDLFTWVNSLNGLLNQRVNTCVMLIHVAKVPSRPEGSLHPRQ